MEVQDSLSILGGQIRIATLSQVMEVGEVFYY